jgi:hypothetical protein
MKGCRAIIVYWVLVIGMLQYELDNCILSI